LSVLKVYRQINSLLTVISALPILPLTWRMALNGFIQALDERFETPSVQSPLSLLPCVSHRHELRSRDEHKQWERRLGVAALQIRYSFAVGGVATRSTRRRTHGPSPVRQLVFSQTLSEMDDPRSGNAQLPESLSPLAGRGATPPRCASRFPVIRVRSGGGHTFVFLFTAKRKKVWPRSPPPTGSTTVEVIRILAEALSPLCPFILKRFEEELPRAGA
jgi:hypothetical protein